MTAASSLLRWALILPIVVVALAVAYRLQQPLGSSVGEPGVASPLETYCYQRVRTQNKEIPTAQCFSVKQGLVQGVWADKELVVKDSTSSDSLTVDPGYVIPGLWDGHGHLLQYGEFLHSVDLFGSQSLDDVRERLRAYLKANPDAGTAKNWVRGVGWDQTAFGRMPTADDIEQDPILKGRYFMLDRIDVHCSWVSQSVLALLPETIPDVPGGEIVRDPGMGVFCDNAVELLVARWPQPTREMKAEAIRTAMTKLNEFGLVGMHDAGATPETLEMYAELAGSEDWTVRVYSMLECEKRNTFCPEDAVKVVQDDGRFTVRSVKLFADGALGSWGSAMLEPYTDHPWTSGSLLINGSSLTEVTKLWVAAGYQVNIHAIGDLANRNAIDAFEAALRQDCSNDAKAPLSDEELGECQSRHRFRIEHSQIIHPDDQKRIQSLRIIPSIQPTHATSDMKYASTRLGPERTATEAYRMKSLLAVNPILGSDFPVEPPNPFQGIYAAVTRKSPQTGRGPDDSSEGWYTEEALSLDEALWGFTGSVAYGGFMEGRAGVIQEGAFADWVVLDEPIEEMSVDDIRQLKVRETWVGGRQVYRRP